ncbi:MAG: YdiU family protein [Polyangiaceae bacterium]|nr:YdiU family protein [Myxococcales bacterium]MCB9585028.1 YdiU family protein [Polyangiaceae bacterium]
MSDPTSGPKPERVHETLGERFYQVVAPGKFAVQKIRFRNQRWAERVGLDALDEGQWLAHFGHFVPLPGAQRQPLALSYHGHQFDVYNSQLGDGRGFLFAQLRDLANARLLDLGTKGSGRTPYSRGGDGRLTLKGGFREVLATELLESLGVYTSKSFSLIETGEALERHDEPSPTRSCVLVRLSHSHVRIGTFQRLYSLGHTDSIERLVDYCNQHLLGLSFAASAGRGERCVGFLREVTRRAAHTTALWLSAGFVHGVLNSDNLNVTGESFDYGPYRFLPELDPSFTAAYFDHTGLYAYGHQARAVWRNLQRLASSLEGLASREERQGAISDFEPELELAHAAAILRRLGLTPNEPDSDVALAQAAVTFLERSRCSFAGFFFDWFGGELSRERALSGPRSRDYQRPEIEPLLSLWRDYTPRPGVTEALSDAYFRGETPCDLLIDEIESLWTHVAERDDWAPFEDKIAEIRRIGELTGLRCEPLSASP